VRRGLQEGLRVVEDDLHAGLDEVVGDALGSGAGDGEDADDDLLVLDRALERMRKYFAAL